MDALIDALVREVRVREGGDVNAEISKGLAANLKLRLKCWLADTLGVVTCHEVTLARSNELLRHHSINY